MKYFNYNGKLLKEDTAVISANSRAARYGDGLFETMKSVRGKLVLSDEHFPRLWKGMEMLKFKIPVHLSPEIFEKKIAEVLKKNGHENRARVRLTILRGDGGLYDEIDHSPNYIIQTWNLPDHTGEWNSNGLVLGIYHDAKKSCDTLCNIKHNNFLPYVMAALYAKEQKWNDAILLNSAGRICDSSIANIFLIKNGRVHTPSLDEGCIAGIMRKTVLQYLRDNGYELAEGQLSTDDLLQADEVFLTNSILDIRWVQSIGEKKYTSSITQKIYTGIQPTIS